MRALDTNVLARWILSDDVRQARTATDLIASGERFLVPETVLLELAWLLQRAGMTRSRVRQTLAGILAEPTFATTDPDSLSEALRHLDAGGDPGDAFHLASARGADAIVTFDADFAKRARKARARPRVDLIG